MTRRWIVRPLAESDLDHAATWYNDQQSGLGLRFLDAVDQVFERIRVKPMQFPAVSAHVRRALLNTFPYAVYFRVTDQVVVVLAVLHLRRHPDMWRARSTRSPLSSPSPTSRSGSPFVVTVYQGSQ